MSQPRDPRPDPHDEQQDSRSDKPGENSEQGACGRAEYRPPEDAEYGQPESAGESPSHERPETPHELLHEDPMDVGGCLWFVVRFTGCSLLLYILMFAAILAVAIVTLLIT